MIGIGALIGLGIVAIDEILRRTAKRQFPPLAVALGIYLPMSVTIMVVVGAFAGNAYNSWVSRGKNPDVAVRLGILLASGLIVGEGLLGVAKSGLIAATSKEFPFAIAGDSFEPVATIVSLIAFPVIVFLLYRWAGRLAPRL